MSNAPCVVVTTRLSGTDFCRSHAGRLSDSQENMHMTETLKAFEFPDGSYLFETPILGEIHSIEATDYGWRGKGFDGTCVEVRHRDPSRKPEIPKRHLLVQRGKGYMEDVGVYVIKRKRARRRVAERRP
jgi:hypothetical protein